MPPGRPNPKEMGRLVALAQIGAEMVVPIVLGLAVDHYWAWSPWGVIAGTVVGFVGGLLHLLAMLKRFDEIDVSKHPPDGP